MHRTGVLRLGLLGLAIVLIASSSEAQAQANVEAAALVWSEGDRNGAYRLVVDHLREAPRDTAALALRLDLEIAGAPGGLPFLQKRRLRKTARTLLAIDSMHVRANTVLGKAALDDVLLYQRAIKLGGSNVRRQDHLPGDLTALLPESSGPTTPGRLDLRVALRELGWIDASGSAERDAQTAERHLLRAIRARPTDPEAARLLATLYVTTDQTDELATLADLVRIARPEAPEALMIAGLAAHRKGRSRESEATFARALERMAPEERARVEDISSLKPPDSRQPDAAFWAERDLRLLTDVNERRLEHLARVVEADLLFSFGDQPGTATPRGQIYVRYGPPPLRRLVSLGPYARPIYPGDPSDTARYDVWQYDGYRYVFNDFYLGGRYTFYSPAADAYTHGGRLSQQAMTDDAMRTDRDLRRSNPEDAAPQPGTLQLDALVSAFRGTDGESEVVVVIGGEGDPPVGQRGLYLLRDDRPVARDERESAPTETETGWVETGRVRSLPGAYTLGVEVESADAYGVHRQRVTVRPFSASGLEVSDLLLASSIDEADARPGAPLVRGGQAIVPTITTTYAPGAPLYVYAEIYALALRDGRSQATVETALIPEDTRPRLRRLWDGLTGGRGRTAYSVSTDIAGDTATEAVPLFIDTTGQPPGRYTLQLRITDRVADAAVVAERDIVLE